MRQIIAFIQLYDFIGNYFFWNLLKHSMVFLSKQAIVIGPTPPGTGVKAFATFETSSKATSPTIPLSVLLIPTSITIASFLTQSAFTSSGIRFP